MSLTGTVLGYDPGGNDAHGIATFTYECGKVIDTSIQTFSTANEVINQAKNIRKLMAIGVDTLTYWSTGKSGWRPADRWLRKQYPPVANSIVSPNSLFGSMGLNGMSVLIALKEANPDLIICETHPKVLHYEFDEREYDYLSNHQSMDTLLSNIFETNIITKNDHEWDAAVSVHAVTQGLQQEWETDLHTLPCSDKERLIKPCGDTHYWWPHI